MKNNLFSIIKNKLKIESDLITSQEELSQYLKGTEGLDMFTDKKRTLLAVIKIRKSQHIELILELANECAKDPDMRFTIHPISTGKNWGYGTSQPPSTENNVILIDLAYLNKIIDFDEDLGLITLEPGVTQRQLSEYLIENDFDYMVPATGAGPDCSILANALERGYGITPYTEHFAAVTAIHGYWANGSEYQSAIYHLDKTEKKFVDKTFKWGVGPYIEGLFTQSSYGIVTKMTLRLAKRKQAFTSFFIQLDKDAFLEDVVPLIRKVLQDYEGIVGSINLMDKRRVLSMFAENPNGSDKHQVMHDGDIVSLAKKLQTPSWTIVGTIYGTKSIVKAAKSEINSIFRQLPSKRIYSDGIIIKMANLVINNFIPHWLIKKIPLLSMAKEQLTSFNLGEEIMLGIPNRVALKLAYWRNPNGNTISQNSMQPHQDGCGLLWYAPLITMKPEIMRTYVDFIREICPKHNIEPFITFTNLKHDCVDSTIPIVFDLSNPEAVKDAHNCLKELVEEGLKKGFVPYRLNIDQQQYLLNKDNNFWQTANDIKRTLDPNNILSPQRYNPS